METTKKVKRQVICIDEDKCTGCGQCIPGCPEGALQIIDGKAKLVKESYCDGLGACLGECPEGALKVIEKEVDEYDEVSVIKNIQSNAPDKLDEHIHHITSHGMELPEEAKELLKQKPHNHSEHSCCPATALNGQIDTTPCSDSDVKINSQLRHWPIKLRLLPPTAPFLKNTDLLLLADCCGVAYPQIHSDLLKNKSIAIVCPKFEDVEFHTEKLSEIIKNSELSSITVVHMEVPCCFGLVNIAKNAVNASGVDVPLKEMVISREGKILEQD